MIVVAGDLLSVTNGVIGHQTNAKYVMGAGLAAQIANKWPVVLAAYRAEKPGLGECQTVAVTGDLWVANLVGQAGFGRNKVYTVSRHLRSALSSLAKFAYEKDIAVYLPYRLGCGLGGGDWFEISKILNEVLPFAVIMRL